MMLDSILITIFTFAAETRDAFLWPATEMLRLFDTRLPGLMDLAGIDSDDPVSVLIAAALIWLAVGAVITAALRFVRRTLLQIAAICRVIAFRIKLALRGVKTQVVCAQRKYLIWRGNDGHDEPGLVEFDDLEIAILRFGHARGPGYALSAPELAEAFSLRPAQVQRSIDSLAKNRMLEYSIGSTDGFDNYRLTRSAPAFLAIYDRQQADIGLIPGNQPA